MKLFKHHRSEDSCRDADEEGESDFTLRSCEWLKCIILLNIKFNT